MAVDPRDELWAAAFATWYDAYYEELVSEALIAIWLRLDEVAKIAVALTASGSAIAGLALWKQPDYAWMWPVLTVASAFLAVVAEKLAVSFRLRDHGETMRAFSSLRIELDTFIYRMRIDPTFDVGAFTSELVLFRKRYGDAYLRIRSDSLVTKGLQRKCQRELDEQIGSVGVTSSGESHASNEETRTARTSS